MVDPPQNNPPPPSSSSSSSSSSPPSAIRVPVGGHGGSASGVGGGGGGGGSGGSGESSAIKKISHSHGGASTSTGGHGGEGKRKRGELIDAPKSDPICSLCGKRFGSWKGVFGHLRAHPERTWRGAFPPPAATASAAGHEQRQRQLLAPTLLNIAQQTLQRLRHDIDLNKVPPQESPPPPPGPSAPPQGSSHGGRFDLNLPPLPEREEEKETHNTRRSNERR